MALPITISPFSRSPSNAHTLLDGPTLSRNSKKKIGNVEYNVEYNEGRAGHTNRAMSIEHTHNFLYLICVFYSKIPFTSLHAQTPTQKQAETLTAQSTAQATAGRMSKCW